MRDTLEHQEDDVRTTLSLDDDVMAAAKAMAIREGKTIGAIVSTLARAALQPQTAATAVRNGVPLLPRRPGAVPVTLEFVNRLRDELE